MAGDLRLTTQPDDLARLYDWLEDVAASVGETLRGRMHVALEEAVMNVAMHGLGLGRADAAIVVRFLAGDGAVVLTVEDAGPAFDPVAGPAARPASREAPGGLGLRLLRSYCKDMAYERVDGMNRLTLRFAQP